MDYIENQANVQMVLYIEGIRRDYFLYKKREKTETGSKELVWNFLIFLELTLYS